MYKVFVTLAILAAASAAPPHHQATSFVSFNNDHSSVHHIDSAPAPALTKYAIPSAHVHALPSAPAYHSVPQYSAPVYAAPLVKVAAPAVAKYAAVPVAKYAHAPAYNHHEEQYADAPAQYEFAYAIADQHTGDIHSQQEHRDGDHVQGQYSLHEADGTVRIVKYSDDGHGFNAVVEREGHPTEAPVYKKLVAVAAPHYHH